MPEANDQCKNRIPMSEWIKEDSPECRPCLLSPAAAWYYEELNDQGHTEEANHLKGVVSDPDVSPGQVAEELDAIKLAAPKELRARLNEFDCTVQVGAKDIV